MNLIHFKSRGSITWLVLLKFKSKFLYCLVNLSFRRLLFFLLFLIVYLIRLECITSLSASAHCFLISFLVRMFYLSFLILSKINLFYDLTFCMNNLCLEVVEATLKEAKLWVFLLSISYIFLINDLF